MSDRDRIQDALHRYCRGVDRRNWELVQSAFHPGATLDQGDFKGKIEAMIATMRQRHAVVEQSAHLLTNILIEFAGPDCAVVESYFLAFLRNAHVPPGMRAALLGRAAPATGKIDMRSLGRYVDRFERRDGEWRIASRVCIAETLTGVPAPEAPTLSQAWVVASREADDALWAMRREAGLEGPPETVPP
jgi:hypothetical protein